jgi:hypothetical protein
MSSAYTRALSIYAELARWYELHLEQISHEYPNDNDHPGRIARQALAERERITNAINETGDAA